MRDARDPRRDSGAAADDAGGGGTGGGGGGGDLRELFDSFCAFGAGQRGQGEMDNAKFVKFCKETGIIDRRFTATDADLLFSKVKPKGGRTINYATMAGPVMDEVARKKGCNADDVVAALRGGPVARATVADAVALHDDKSQYTGVYAAGGPSTVDTRTADLSNITNRNAADVRGVEYR